MNVVIYGRKTCPYCVKAVDLAEKLTMIHDNFEYEYIDIEKVGLTKDDLTEMVGKKVETVPQVFIDKKPIGGFTDFDAYAKANLGA